MYHHLNFWINHFLDKEPVIKPCHIPKDDNKPKKRY